MKFYSTFIQIYIPRLDGALHLELIEFLEDRLQLLFLSVASPLFHPVREKKFIIQILIKKVYFAWIYSSLPMKLHKTVNSIEFCEIFDFEKLSVLLQIIFILVDNDTSTI